MNIIMLGFVTYLTSGYKRILFEICVRGLPYYWVFFHVILQGCMYCLGCGRGYTLKRLIG
ncbi:hypothetical protein BDV25DRAFT_166495 [Aspergillus avenaceus]|uniref:Uncharacterized protein n=1 Tax=Aspergillus avenaceus TaxID=36643 RepID=A0A5N6TDX4_ASPAV|nr:hypothetical protein BDV25DRAFT_166495 [Aspergillus avenaceus]